MKILFSRMLRGREIFPFLSRSMMSRGPVPPENNPPITPQYYQPSRFVISNIVRGKTTLVTMTPTTINDVTVEPNYVIGQLVKLIMTPQSGMPQINRQVGYVLSVPTSTSIEVGIDSRSFNAFVSGSGNTSPQIIALGDVNSGEINSSGIVNNTTYIQGSFINIS